MIKILIVEDEEPIANLIRMNLVKAGYQCETAFDGEAAADAISERTFDLILLDIMLPKLNGYEVLEYAKSVDIPVIFLTAMGETQQKVKGLRLGAEDYIAKPFEIAELLARVETVLRRCHKTQRKLHLLNIDIDTDSHTVMQEGAEVDLTTKEYELLLFFLRNKNRALYRETIYENVWGRRVQRHRPDGGSARAAPEKEARPGGTHCSRIQGRLSAGMLTGGCDEPFVETVFYYDTDLCTVSDCFWHLDYPG